jgi:hypothetical protein
VRKAAGLHNNLVLLRQPGYRTAVEL